MLLSAIVVVLIIAGAIHWWYPGQLAWAAGLVSMLTILLAVDLILGPALTFLVYKPGKKSLVFDLSVIAAFQIAALVFGVSSIYQARPVYLAFVVDRFETVAAADLEEEMLAEAAPEFQSLPSNGPRWVGVELPTDPREAEELLMAESMHGTGPELIPRYYRPYEQAVQLQKSRPVSELESYNDKEEVARKIDGLANRRDRLRFFPLAGRDRDLTVLVTADSGTVVDIVDLRPWAP